MTDQLDPIIHPLPRLSICALLAAGQQWLDFAAVREATGLSDSAVSKNSRALEDAGYLEVRKGGIGRRPRTWFCLTPLGRRNYESHVRALRALVTPPPEPSAGETATAG